MKKIGIVFVAFFVIVQTICAMNIYLVPFSPYETEASLFNRSARDNCMKALCDLREAFSALGYTLQLHTLEAALEDDAQVIVFELPLDRAHWQSHLPKNSANVFLMLWEPPTVLSNNYNPSLHAGFGTVFTLFDAMVDNKKYHKLFYPQPRLSMIDEVVPFHEKKLCTFIACNKASKYPGELYSHRLATVWYFEQHAPQDFDFYGIGWPSKLITYKGSVDHKVPQLKKYKFCFCYENMKNSGGYITEKIFDAFVAGCVPIYLGAENVAKYIPKNCFIAREDFATMEELHAFLKVMPEGVYNSYLENIRNFFASYAATVFSIEHFIDIVLEAVVPDYDKTKVFSEEQLDTVERSKMLHKING